MILSRNFLTKRNFHDLLGGWFDIRQRDKIVSQLLGGGYVMVGEGQIRAFNTDRYHPEYREGRGACRLLRRGRYRVATNSVGSTTYCFSENRSSTGRYQEIETLIILLFAKTLSNNALTPTYEAFVCYILRMCT